jgi:glycosyltransferase involved in cell wall biosynthesis
MKMKIGYLIPQFSRDHGGPYTHLLNLIKKFKKRTNFSSIVYCSSIIGKNKKNTVEIQKINQNLTIKAPKTHFSFRLYHIGLKLFSILMKDAKLIDIFHSHGIRSFQEDIALLIALIFRKPIIITPHGALTYHNSFMEWFTKIGHDSIIGKIVKKYSKSYWIAVSKKEVGFIEKFGVNPNKISYIPHGIDTNYFKKVDSSNLRAKYHLEGKKVILYLGRISKTKGVEHLILAFNQLSEKYPNAHLLIGGSDYGYLDECKRYMKENNLESKITFAGFIARKDLPQYYSLAELVVYPGYKEIFGIVILEANSCEKPVIASNHWGPVEIIKDGETGFLVPYGNIEILEEKMAFILDNPTISMQMGKTARQHMVKNFTWNHAVNEHYKLYKKILKSEFN